MEKEIKEEETTNSPPLLMGAGSVSLEHFRASVNKVKANVLLNNTKLNFRSANQLALKDAIQMLDRIEYVLLTANKSLGEGIALVGSENWIRENLTLTHPNADLCTILQDVFNTPQLEIPFILKLRELLRKDVELSGSGNDIANDMLWHYSSELAHLFFPNADFSVGDASKKRPLPAQEAIVVPNDAMDLDVPATVPPRKEVIIIDDDEEGGKEPSEKKARKDAPNDPILGILSGRRGPDAGVTTPANQTKYDSMVKAMARFYWVRVVKAWFIDIFNVQEIMGTVPSPPEAGEKAHTMAIEIAIAYRAGLASFALQYVYTNGKFVEPAYNQLPKTLNLGHVGSEKRVFHLSDKDAKGSPSSAKGKGGEEEEDNIQEEEEEKEEEEKNEKPINTANYRTRVVFNLSQAMSLFMPVVLSVAFDQKLPTTLYFPWHATLPFISGYLHESAGLRKHRVFDAQYIAHLLNILQEAATIVASRRAASQLSDPTGTTNFNGRYDRLNSAMSTMFPGRGKEGQLGEFTTVTLPRIGKLCSKPKLLHRNVINIAINGAQFIMPTCMIDFFGYQPPSFDKARKMIDETKGLSSISVSNYIDCKLFLFKLTKVFAGRTNRRLLRKDTSVSLSNSSMSALPRTVKGYLNYARVSLSGLYKSQQTSDSTSPAGILGTVFELPITAMLLEAKVDLADLPIPPIQELVIRCTHYSRSKDLASPAVDIVLSNLNALVPCTFFAPFNSALKSQTIVVQEAATPTAGNDKLIVLTETLKSKKQLEELKERAEKRAKKALESQKKHAEAKEAKRVENAQLEQDPDTLAKAEAKTLAKIDKLDRLAQQFFRRLDREKEEDATRVEKDAEKKARKERLAQEMKAQIERDDKKAQQFFRREERDIAYAIKFAEKKNRLAERKAAQTRLAEQKTLQKLAKQKVPTPIYYDHVATYGASSIYRMTRGQYLKEFPDHFAAVDTPATAPSLHSLWDGSAPSLVGVHALPFADSLADLAKLTEAQVQSQIAQIKSALTNLLPGITLHASFAKDKNLVPEFLDDVANVLGNPVLKYWDPSTAGIASEEISKVNQELLALVKFYRMAVDAIQFSSMQETNEVHVTAQSKPRMLRNGLMIEEHNPSLSSNTPLEYAKCLHLFKTSPDGPLSDMVYFMRPSAMRHSGGRGWAEKILMRNAENRFVGSSTWDLSNADHRELFKETFANLSGFAMVQGAQELTVIPTKEGEKVSSSHSNNYRLLIVDFKDLNHLAAAGAKFRISPHSMNHLKCVLYYTDNLLSAEWLPLCDIWQDAVDDNIVEDEFVANTDVTFNIARLEDPKSKRILCVALHLKSLLAVHALNTLRALGQENPLLSFTMPANLPGFKGLNAKDSAVVPLNATTKASTLGMAAMRDALETIKADPENKDAWNTAFVQAQGEFRPISSDHLGNPIRTMFHTIVKQAVNIQAADFYANQKKPVPTAIKEASADWLQNALSFRDLFRSTIEWTRLINVPIPPRILDDSKDIELMLKSKDWQQETLDLSSAKKSILKFIQEEMKEKQLRYSSLSSLEKHVDVSPYLTMLLLSDHHAHHTEIKRRIAAATTNTPNLQTVLQTQWATRMLFFAHLGMFYLRSSRADSLVHVANLLVDRVFFKHVSPLLLSYSVALNGFRPPQYLDSFGMAKIEALQKRSPSDLAKFFAASKISPNYGAFVSPSKKLTEAIQATGNVAVMKKLMRIHSTANLDMFLTGLVRAHATNAQIKKLKSEEDQASRAIFLAEAEEPTTEKKKRNANEALSATEDECRVFRAVWEKYFKSDPRVTLVTKTKATLFEESATLSAFIGSKVADAPELVPALQNALNVLTANFLSDTAPSREAKSFLSIAETLNHIFSEFEKLGGINIPKEVFQTQFVPLVLHALRLLFDMFVGRDAIHSADIFNISRSLATLDNRHQRMIQTIELVDEDDDSIADAPTNRELLEMAIAFLQLPGVASLSIGVAISATNESKWQSLLSTVLVEIGENTDLLNVFCAQNKMQAAIYRDAVDGMDISFTAEHLNALSHLVGSITSVAKTVLHGSKDMQKKISMHTAQVMTSSVAKLSETRMAVESWIGSLLSHMDSFELLKRMFESPLFLEALRESPKGGGIKINGNSVLINMIVRICNSRLASLAGIMANHPRECFLFRIFIEEAGLQRSRHHVMSLRASHVALFLNGINMLIDACVEGKIEEGTISLLQTIRPKLIARNTALSAEENEVEEEEEEEESSSGFDRSEDEDKDSGDDIPSSADDDERLIAIYASDKKLVAEQEKKVAKQKEKLFALYHNTRQVDAEEKEDADEMSVEDANELSMSISDSSKFDQESSSDEDHMEVVDDSSIPPLVPRPETSLVPRLEADADIDFGADIDFDD